MGLRGAPRRPPGTSRVRAPGAGSALGRPDRPAAAARRVDGERRTRGRSARTGGVRRRWSRDRRAARRRSAAAGAVTAARTRAAGAWQLAGAASARVQKVSDRPGGRDPALLLDLGAVVTCRGGTSGTEFTRGRSWRRAVRRIGAQAVSRPVRRVCRRGQHLAVLDLSGTPPGRTHLPETARPRVSGRREGPRVAAEIR